MRPLRGPKPWKNLDRLKWQSTWPKEMDTLTKIHPIAMTKEPRLPAQSRRVLPEGRFFIKLGESLITRYRPRARTEYSTLQFWGRGSHQA